MIVLHLWMVVVNKVTCHDRGQWRVNLQVTGQTRDDCTTLMNGGSKQCHVPRSRSVTRKSPGNRQRPSSSIKRKKGQKPEATNCDISKQKSVSNSTNMNLIGATYIRSSKLSSHASQARSNWIWFQTTLDFRILCMNYNITSKITIFQ